MAKAATATVRPAFEEAVTVQGPDLFGASLATIDMLMQFIPPNTPSEAALASDVGYHIRQGFPSDIVYAMKKELTTAAKYIGESPDNFKAWCAVLDAHDAYARKSQMDSLAAIKILSEIFVEMKPEENGLLRKNGSALSRHYFYEAEKRAGDEGLNNALIRLKERHSHSAIRDKAIQDFAKDYAGNYRNKNPKTVLMVVGQTGAPGAVSETSTALSIAIALRAMADSIEQGDPVTAIDARIKSLEFQRGHADTLKKLERFVTERLHDYPDKAGCALHALHEQIPAKSPARFALAETHRALAELWRAKIEPAKASHSGGPLRNATTHAFFYARDAADKEEAARYMYAFAKEIMAYERPFSELTEAAEVLPQGSPLRDEILQAALDLHRRDERLIPGCVEKLEELIPVASPLHGQVRTMRQQYDREHQPPAVSAADFLSRHQDLRVPALDI